MEADKKSQAASRMQGFAFHSEQVHSTYENGIEQTKKNIVNIKNGKGTKTVTIVKNGKANSSTKKLSTSEVKQIKQNQFIPGLFKPCYTCLKNTTRSKSSSRSKTQKKKGSR
jgi:hypothetical protein